MTPSTRFAPLPRRVASMAVIAAAAGCACPDIAELDSVVIELDRAPAADETWELAVSPDGEPACTVLLTADDVIADPDDPDCARRSIWPGGDGYGVRLSDEAPRTRDLALTIGGVVVLEASLEVAYRVYSPDGPLCGERLDGAVSLAVPAG